ncbi:MAG: hypothetical protein WC615_11765 [Mucilaginibacter sp.]|jgi:hypothetical protein|uniref:hypothetical protein n=1 Tax=Mucilaginibacter sp. TaxID=1882438 RepID=UPI0035612A3A
MSSEINSIPNYDLLIKYGYYPQLWTDEPTFKTLKEEENYKTKFYKVIKNHGLEEHADTLWHLTVALHEKTIININKEYSAEPARPLRPSEEYKLLHDHKSFLKQTNARELASLLLLFQNTSAQSSTNIKVSSSAGTMQINSKQIFDWLYMIIKEKLELDNFPIGILGEDLYELIQPDSNPSSKFEIVPQSKLKEIVNTKILTLGQVKTIHLTAFLRLIYMFLISETQLTPKEGVKYANKPLIAVYDIAAVFKWFKVKPIAPSSENKIPNDSQNLKAKLIRVHFTNFDKKFSR